MPKPLRFAALALLVMPAFANADEAVTQAMRNRLRAEQTAETIRRNQDDAYLQQAKRNAARALFDERSAALSKCRAAPRGRLYAAAQAVITNLDAKKSAQNAIAKEEKIGAISGTVDMYVLHQAGQTIAEADEDIQRRWVDYKRLGGDAESPASVPRHLSPNPCAKEKAAMESARPEAFALP